MAEIDFGGTWKKSLPRKNLPWKRPGRYWQDETVAVLGYGVQGPGQALNMRDNGIHVIVGAARGRRLLGAGRGRRLRSRQTLFPIEEAARKAPSFNTCSPTPARWPPGR
jgi:ketol-acid reductoisomerase